MRFACECHDCYLLRSGYRARVDPWNRRWKYVGAPHVFCKCRECELYWLGFALGAPRAR